MPTIDFNSAFNTLKTGVINLAETELKNYVAQASKDGQALLDSMKNDLQTWTQQLANGQITKDDFTFNVLSEKDSLEMAALEQAGLAEIQVDQFKADVMTLITTTITALIP
jgi:hypothetical protein